MSDTLIDIAAFFNQYPEELHQIIHIMRVSQQHLYDLNVLHQRIVKGNGMIFADDAYTIGDNEIVVNYSNGKRLVMSYEITDEPLTNEELDEIRRFLNNIIRIDDDFANVSLDDIKSLDLTNSGFL